MPIDPPNGGDVPAMPALPIPNSPFCRERIHAIVGGLSEAEYEGQIRAVAVLWVDTAGDIHSSYFGQPNSTFPLIAGMQLLNQEILASITNDPEAQAQPPELA